MAWYKLASDKNTCLVAWAPTESEARERLDAELVKVWRERGFEARWGELDMNDGAENLFQMWTRGACGVFAVPKANSKADF